MLQRVAARCCMQYFTVLQCDECVAVRCSSVLYAVCCSVLQCVTVCCSALRMLQRVAVRRSMQFVAVCCSVLHCSVLQCVTVC